MVSLTFPIVTAIAARRARPITARVWGREYISGTLFGTWSLHSVPACSKGSIRMIVGSPRVRTLVYQG